jgi:hypothetical protein
MEASPSSPGLSLSLRRRLRRAFLIALIFGLWAPFKLIWEMEIGRDQDFLRYHGATMTRALRDELGQGLTIGVLSGMRSVVADLVWLNVVTAWMNQDWWKMGGYVNLSTALQPRAPVFWDMGGWQLAWNASLSAQYDTNQPNELRRIKAARFWVQQGLDIYKRGIENNPTNWRLWADTGNLYNDRLKDYRSAAYYYGEASLQPDAMTYLERFPARMYDSHHAKDPESEYVEWKKLWERLTPAQKKEKQHTADEIERQIRALENKLSIPKEKRIFPN